MVTASTPFGKQHFNVAERRTPKRRGDEIALPAVRVRNTDELDARKIGEDARMVAAHDADADHTYA